MDEVSSYYYQKRKKGAALSLKRNFAYMLASKASLIVVTLFTGALINRSLGPFNRGIFAEVQTWVGLFVVIFGIGMQTAIYHFANKSLYGYDDKARFITVFLLSLAYSILAALALTLCIRYWPGRFSPTSANYLVLLNTLIITTMLTANLTVFLQAMGNIRLSAFIGISQAVANLAIISYGYLFMIMDVRFVIQRLVIIQLISLSFLFIIFLKKGLIFGRFSLAMAKGLIATGIKQHIATISTFIYTRVNQLIVFRCCGESETGIFSVALTLAFALIFIPEAFRAVLYPRVIHSDDDYDVTVRSLRIGFYVWGSIAVFIMLFAKPFLLIYGGDSFLSSINAFRILMVAAWFLPLSSLLAPYRVKRGFFGMASFLAVILGIISVSMNILLVPRYASLGAASATALTCLIGFVITILFLGYLSKKNPLVIFKPDFKKELVFIRKLYLREKR